MFTGIIEEIGSVKIVQPIAGGIKLNISTLAILDDLKVDDSVAVNGVCLTTTKVEPDGFWADAVGETLNKTTLAKISTGFPVNLERAVRPVDRLGGHIVQGHVDGIGTILQIKKLGNNYHLEVEIPPNLTRYVINEGSITIDGISLTAAKILNNKVSISIIPHTWTKTILHKKKMGDKVNIETDVIAKYLEKLFTSKKINGEDIFTDDWFNRLGYK